MFLIDGYNLLYQTNLEYREELIAKINQFCSFNNNQALIIFDGFSSIDLSTRLVEVRFAGEADLEIERILTQNTNPTQLTLISSDKDLIYTARHNNVKVVLSEQFNYLIPEQKLDQEKPEANLSDMEVQKQLKEFGYFKNKK